MAENTTKTISKMTVEDCLKELKAQVKAGVEFDDKFSKDTPLKELRAMVKDGREVLAEEEDEEEVGGADEADESEEGDDEESETDEDDSESENEEDSEDKESEDDEEEDDEDDDVPPPPRKKAVKLPPEGVLRVVCKDGTYRDYSHKSHGQHFKTLAKQYAENPLVKGQILKSGK